KLRPSVTCGFVGTGLKLLWEGTRVPHGLAVDATVSTAGTYHSTREAAQSPLPRTGRTKTPSRVPRPVSTCAHRSIGARGVVYCRDGVRISHCVPRGGGLFSAGDASIQKLPGLRT